MEAMALIEIDGLPIKNGDFPHRNRWFTVLKNGGSFHGELLVISRWYFISSLDDEKSIG